MTVPSPCIGVCIVGADRLCEGCFRTLDEIARWSMASDAEKQQMLNAVSGRVFAGKLSPATIQNSIDSLCKPSGGLGDTE